MALIAIVVNVALILAAVACIYGWLGVAYLWIQSGGGAIGAVLLPFGFFAWMVPWALLRRME
jgi:hypothetical protein